VSKVPRAAEAACKGGRLRGLKSRRWPRGVSGCAVEEYVCLIVHAEDRGYDPSKAKFCWGKPIAQKYSDGNVQSTPKGGWKGRQSAWGEPGGQSRASGSRLLDGGATHRRRAVSTRGSTGPPCEQHRRRAGIALSAKSRLQSPQRVGDGHRKGLVVAVRLVVSGPEHGGCPPAPPRANAAGR
jgi:hypothetical protein